MIKKNKHCLKRKGQVLMVFVVTWTLLFASLVLVFHTGTLVGERIRIQQAADNVAYSGAVFEARGLNYVAYCNRAIVGDLAFLAYITAVISHMQAWAEYISDIGYVTSFIPYVGPVINQILQTVSDVVDEVASVLEPVRDSSLWETCMDSIFFSQRSMLVFTALKIESVQEEITNGFGDNYNLNGGGGLSFRFINMANFNDMFKNAEGEGDDLREVVEDTISSWTKAQDDGAVPLADREWMFPRRNSFLYTGVQGNFTINDDGFRASDRGFIRIGSPCWRHGWCMSTIPIHSWHRSERQIDWDDIGYYKWNGDAEKSGVYAYLEKSGNDVGPEVGTPGRGASPFLYQNLLDVPFGRSGALVVPNNSLVALSKAVATYKDPEAGSSRHSTLSSQNKEPNLFNPFWKAEMAAINHDPGSGGGARSDEEMSAGVADTTIRLLFHRYTGNTKRRLIH